MVQIQEIIGFRQNVITMNAQAVQILRQNLTKAYAEKNTLSSGIITPWGMTNDMAFSWGRAPISSSRTRTTLSAWAPAVAAHRRQRTLQKGPGRIREHQTLSQGH